MTTPKVNVITKIDYLQSQCKDEKRGEWGELGDAIAAIEHAIYALIASLSRKLAWQVVAQANQRRAYWQFDMRFYQKMEESFMILFTRMTWKTSRE